MVGEWYIGCFPDSALLRSHQSLGVPGDTFSSQTNFTEQNAVECAVKCGVASPTNVYAAFSQTGICLCMDTSYSIGSAVSSSLCAQKTCDLIGGLGDCDGNTYHWLANVSKLIVGVKIVTSGILTGAVPQNITVKTVPGKLKHACCFS